MSVHNFRALKPLSEEQAKAQYERDMEALLPVDLTVEQVKAIMHEGGDYSDKAMQRKEMLLQATKWRLDETELFNAQDDVGKGRAFVVNSLRRAGKAGLVATTVALAGPEPTLSVLAGIGAGIGALSTLTRILATSLEGRGGVLEFFKEYGDHFTFTSADDLKPRDELSPVVIKRAIRNREKAIEARELREATRPDREFVARKLDRRIEELFGSKPK